MKIVHTIEIIGELTHIAPDGPAPYPWSMAANQYTTITPRGGGLIHATTIREPFHTACGIEWRGWVIAPLGLTCRACENALETKVKGVKQGRGKKSKRRGR